MSNRLLWSLAAALWVGLAPASQAEEPQTYDMLFRNGTLDDIDRGAELVYSRDVTSALKPEAAERDTGRIALSFGEGESALALLEFRQGEKHRVMGQFPASVGNPMIMLFFETVVRDMAEAAGGSPYYIRNRVKEAMVQPWEIETGEAMVAGQMVPTQTIRMYPFRDDPNTHRMRGFGDLELRVTMSDAVPGWYASLVAEASGGQVYRSAVDFQRVGARP